MSRSARLLLLALLFAAVAAVELRLSWSTLRFAIHPESVHYRLPMSDSLVKGGEAFGGLQPGDHVLAIDGVAVASRWQTHQQVIRRPVGAPVRVTVERAGQRVEVEAPTRPWPMTVPARISTVVQNVVTAWFCIALGFLIALRRPDDRMAWLVLFILLGLAQIHVYLFITDEWNALLAGLMRLMTPFLRFFGVVAWLWFGLDFYAGRRLLPWLRWPLSLATIYHAAQVSVESLARLHFPDWLPQVTAAGLPLWLAAGITLSGLLLGFANLLYRLTGDLAPDARRRLRVLLAGMVAGRGPILALELAALFGVPESRLPLLYLAFATSAIFLVPVTFAYVVIVDRAMDVGVVVRQGLQYAFARRGVDALRGTLALLPLLLVENRWWAIGGALAAVMLAGPIAERLRLWIDRRFFREAVQAEHLLADIAEPLRAIADPSAVLDVVAGRVASALHVTEVRSWLGPGEPLAGMGLAAGMTLPIEGARGVLGGLQLGSKKSEEPYTPNEKQLLHAVARQTALAMENATLTRAVADEAAKRERMQRELEIAREVQARLLPKRDPEIAGLSVAGLCRPAQSTGGDSYDYIQAGSRWLLTVADVAGKGVPAALLMSNVQAALRGLTAAGGAVGLADTLVQLNQLVFDATPANRFITMFALAYEPESRTVRYASAGHNPAALLPSGAVNVEWIRTKSVALGLRRRSDFAEASFTLQPADCLVLYTDGVTEAVNTAGEEFGEARLAEAIGQCRSLGAKAMRDALLAAVDDFVAGAPQHDDITLVVIRATG